ASSPMVPVSPPSAPSYTAPPAGSGPSTFSPSSPSAPAYNPSAPAYNPSAPSFNPSTPSLSSPPAGTQSPPPAWDPYAAPGSQPYSSTVPSPYVPAPPPYTGNAEPIYPDGLPTVMPPDWLQQAQAPLRFLQEARLRGAWLAPFGGNSSKLGVTVTDISATFAIPVAFNQAPVLITPGAAGNWWNGPVSQAPKFADLPPATYDTYIDAGWQPQVTPWLSANIGVRTGLYTDFHAVNSHSIRIMGRGLGVITLTPTLQLAVGVVYLDRNLVKMLPAGGLIWTPNVDTRFELLFPNPKITRRWRTIGTVDVWGYVSAEYGGGAWTIRRANGTSDDFDYNDIRVMLGAETFSQRGIHGNFEVGFVCDRQLVYRSGDPSRFDPSDTMMLRAGVAY
ncbi:MAG TPA: hypothetical protein VGG30_04925, partial [Pirellulales bacterium]